MEARRKCPNLVLVPPNYGLYEKCSAAFMGILREYSDIVEQYSIDEAVASNVETKEEVSPEPESPEEGSVWFIGPTSDGQPARICINPVEFVWNWGTQSWLDWGNSEDEGSYCDVRDEDSDDSTLYELSDRYKGRECMTTDPEVFLLYIHQQFTNDAKHYPFFLLLDQDRAVKYIIDAGLV